MADPKVSNETREFWENLKKTHEKISITIDKLGQNIKKAFNTVQKKKHNGKFDGRSSGILKNGRNGIP